MCLLNKECRTEKAIAKRIQQECLAYIRDNNSISLNYLAQRLNIQRQAVRAILVQKYWGIEKAMRIASVLNFNLSMTIYYPNTYFSQG